VWTDERPDPASYVRVLLRRSASGNGGGPNTKRLWILVQQLARRMKHGVLLG
jgi:hypothetical protein